MDGWSVDWPATNDDDITRPESTPLSIKRSIELHRPTTVVKQQHRCIHTSVDNLCLSTPRLCAHENVPQSRAAAVADMLR